MAPECLIEKIFSAKSDVWAFGVLMHELFTAEEPYLGLEPLKVAIEVGKGELKLPAPENAPTALKEIIPRCFSYSPDERPSMNEICDLLVKPKPVAEQ